MFFITMVLFPRLSLWLNRTLLHIIRTRLGYYRLNDKDLRVLHVSPNFIVVNKQPDIVINTDFPDEFPVNVASQLMYNFPHLANESVRHRFWFCHRLDYVTSGILCVALNKRASHSAQDAFRKRNTRKYYLALVRGHVRDDKISINTSIGYDLRFEEGRRMCTVEKNYCSKPRSAETKLLVLQRGLFGNSPATKILMKPFSGRRHQLRIHCSHVGHNIIGDYAYSNGDDFLPERTYLHAYRLVVPTSFELIDIITDDPFSEAALGNKWKTLENVYDLNADVFDIFNDCEFSK